MVDVEEEENMIMKHITSGQIRCCGHAPQMKSLINILQEIVQVLQIARSHQCTWVSAATPFGKSMPRGIVAVPSNV